MALLAQPGHSVLEVSIAVGFDDAGAFARSFARHCGETPSAYKRRSAEHREPRGCGHSEGAGANVLNKSGDGRARLGKIAPDAR